MLLSVLTAKKSRSKIDSDCLVSTIVCSCRNYGSSKLRDGCDGVGISLFIQVSGGDRAMPKWSSK